MARLTVVNLLPRLMGTYGDTGNELALSSRLKKRGIDAEFTRVEAGDVVPPSADLYLLGGGEDRAQPLAASLIAEPLTRALAEGAAVFAVCAGYQILGHSFTDSRGQTHAGLGVLDVVTRPMATRAVGEVVVNPGLPVDAIVGFENHRGRTRLGPNANPLGHVVAGVGNGDPLHSEGAVQGCIVATYLHGPVLALNPSLADWVLSQIVGPLEPIDDSSAYRARARRLNPVDRYRDALRQT